MKGPMIYRFDSLDSTNAYIKKHLSTLPDRSVVIADIQTCGRGRSEHSWLSGNPDNLFFSFFIKISTPTAFQFCTLTHFLSLITARVLDTYLQGTSWSVQIKWPNDLMIDGHKIGGILAEASWTERGFIGIVLGIGINLSLSQDEKDRIDQPASDLKSYSQTVIHKETIFLDIVHSFLDKLDLYIKDGFPSIRQAFENRLILQRENCQFYLQDDGSLLMLEKNKQPVRLFNPIYQEKKKR